MELNTSELSRRGRQARRPKSSTKVVDDFDPGMIRTVTPEEQQARLRALAAMYESDDMDDADDISDERLQNAVVVRNPWMDPPTKTTLERVQIDSDIIFWILRQVGEEGYQEKMNAMLRKAMEDERAARRQAAEPA